MNNKSNSKSVTRAQVVAAFAELKKEGVENPWEQNEKNKAAWKLYNEFSEAIGAEENEDPAASIKQNQEISIDMIIMDAGFEPDEDNLDTILDFLEQDLLSAQEIGDKKLIADLEEKIAFYNKKREALS